MKRSVLLSLGLLSSYVAAEEQEKPRVFVNARSGWEVRAGVTEQGAVVAGSTNPIQVEVMKSLGEKCPSVVVTVKEEMANYVLVVEHTPGMGAVRKDTNYTVLMQGGDMLAGGATRSKKGAAEAACRAIAADWRSRASRTNEASPESTEGPRPTPTAQGTP